jgi:hypothetical protein
MFSTTGASGLQLYARTTNSTETALGAALLHGAHRYRIEWGLTDVKFYVERRTGSQRDAQRGPSR